MDKHIGVLAETYGIEPAPITPQLFASAGKEHMEKYGKNSSYISSLYLNSHHIVHSLGLHGIN